MKILCILSKPIVPNKEGLFPTLIRIHRRISPDVSILSPGGDGQESGRSSAPSIEGAPIILVDRGVPPATLFQYVLSVRRWRFLKLIWKYRRELYAAERYFSAHGCPDVIAALQSCEDSGILAYLISKRYRVPYVVMEHRTNCQRGLLTAGRLKIFREVVLSADEFLTVSPQLGDCVERVLGDRLSHLITMPNPLPDEFCEVPAELLHSVEEFARGRFVFAGWTKWRDIKRLDLALKAFQKVWKREPNSCLVIAGLVPAWARTLAEDLGLHESVLFTGQLSREEIKKLAYTCDCCILTSDHETFGLPVIEAMAAGKPVVCTRCGGPESIVEGTSHGRVVGTGDVDALARAMLDIMQDRGGHQCRAIRDYCRETYSEGAIFASLKAIYKDVQ